MAWHYKIVVIPVTRECLKCPEDPRCREKLRSAISSFYLCIPYEYGANRVWCYWYAVRRTKSLSVNPVQ